MRREPALALTALALAGCGGAEPQSAQPLATPRVVRAVAPRRPQPSGRYLIARFKHPVTAYARPGGPVLRRLGRRTEFGSPRTAGVVARRGRWLGLTVAERPNHHLAWVRAGAVRLDATDLSLVADRSARLLVLRDGARTVRRVRVAVGRPGAETPLGRYAVTDKLVTRDAGSPYGCCALALSGHQTRLQPGWPGGDRLAVHGTPATWSIGQAVSLGCMRASARDMRALLRHVPLGTPVFVRN